jgi:hypothetical protein
MTGLENEFVSMDIHGLAKVLDEEILLGKEILYFNENGFSACERIFLKNISSVLASKFNGKPLLAQVLMKHNVHLDQLLIVS